MMLVALILISFLVLKYVKPSAQDLKALEEMKYEGYYKPNKYDSEKIEIEIAELKRKLATEVDESVFPTLKKEGSELRTLWFKLRDEYPELSDAPKCRSFNKLSLYEEESPRKSIFEESSRRDDSSPDMTWMIPIMTSC